MRHVVGPTVTCHLPRHNFIIRVLKEMQHITHEDGERAENA